MKYNLNVKNSISLFLFSFFLITCFSFASKNSIATSDYHVTFINKNWNQLHLQVRVGNQSVPENNTLVKDVVLKKGESVNVDYDVLCYYRRDADPDKPNGNFTTWTGTGCFKNQLCEVDNP